MIKDDTRFLETYFEIAVFLDNALKNDKFRYEDLHDVVDVNGYASLYEIARDWAEDFEKNFKEGDDFWEEIEIFCEEKVKDIL